MKEQRALQEKSLSKLIQEHVQAVKMEIQLPGPVSLKVGFPNEPKDLMIDQDMVRSLQVNQQLRAMNIRDDKMTDFKSFGQEESNSNLDTKND